MKALKSFCADAEPFDQVSVVKSLADKARLVFTVIGLVAVGVWAVYTLVAVVTANDVSIQWETEESLEFPYFTVFFQSLILSSISGGKM